AVGKTEKRIDHETAHVVPARELAPTGYEPLFRWIIATERRRRHQRLRRILQVVTGVLALALITFFGWDVRGMQAARNVLQNDNRSALERLRDTQNVPT